MQFLLACSVDLAQLKQSLPEQEVPFSKLKLTKFLTIIEILRLVKGTVNGTVKGTESWLGCCRGDLTLKRGNGRGVFYSA